MPVRITTSAATTPATNEIISQASNIEIHCLRLASLVKNGTLGNLKVGKGFLEWSNSVHHIRMDYTEITLHAIARDDVVVGGKPCIYLQLTNTCLTLNGSAYSSDPNGNQVEEDGDDDSLLEIRLAPEATARGIVDDLFGALCEASSLHQDELDELDDAAFPAIQILNGDVQNNTWITSENVDSFIPNQEQEERLVRLERLLQESQPSNTTNDNGKRKSHESGQFDDAPEDLQR